MAEHSTVTHGGWLTGWITVVVDNVTISVGNENKLSRKVRSLKENFFFSKTKFIFVLVTNYSKQFSCKNIIVNEGVGSKATGLHIFDVQ